MNPEVSAYRLLMKHETNTAMVYAENSRTTHQRTYTFRWYSDNRIKIKHATELVRTLS